MKLSLDAQVLAEAVAWTARAVPQRPVAPILSGLLVEAADDKLTLSAFDYDVSARCEVSADVAEPGRVVLPARILAEVTKALPARRVAELTLSGVEVALSAGAAEFGLLTLPVSDYPSLPEPPATVGTVDAALLHRAVEQLLPCTSKDGTLPMLTGIWFDLSPDGMTLAATDRYLMASRTLPWQSAGVADVAALVPAEALHGLTRTLSAGEVTFGIDDKLAAFSCGGRTTTVRLLDPQFVEYRAWLYPTQPIWATVDKVELVDAVKRASLMADKGTAVRLTWSTDSVLVQAGSDVGRGSDTVPGVALEGDDTFHIAFQPQFLLNALAGVDEQRVRIGMEPGNRPALVAGDGADDGAYRCLAMSLRVA